VLDSQSEKILSQFTDELHRLLSDELVAIILYGSATSNNFVPGASDLNVAIVVKEARFEVLQKLQPRIQAWHAMGFALPLLLDREFLLRGRDVFPMEFQDIKEQHRLLWGEDVWRDVEIDARHLRVQAEHEARSKLLRLRAVYLECAGDQPRLQALMLDSLKTFLVLMRTLSRLHGETGLLTYPDILDKFARRFQLACPRMRQLIAIRARQQQWPSTPLTEFFRDYLLEVQQVIGVVDRLLSCPPTLPDQSG
jgi:predicted nucleotidyltransferase